MPIHERKDKSGKYYQWGERGKKYYFKKEGGKGKAYDKALKQAKAIYASGYR